jgi:hypothetical protein
MRIRSRQSARNGAYPALGDGVWVRRLDGRAGVLVAELYGEVARLWVTQPPSGSELQATYSIRRVASEMTKRT